MHPAVVSIIVVGALLIVHHRRRLRVFPEAGIVERRARGFHRAERDALDARQQAVLADQPVRVGGLLVQVELLDHDAEDVRDRFVERAGLVVVVEPGGVLGHAVGELVADDVEGLGEVVDEGVAVAEDHLLGVPEGVAVLLAEVDAADEGQPAVVDGVALEDRGVEVEGAPQVVVAVADGFFGALCDGLALGQD